MKKTIATLIGFAFILAGIYLEGGSLTLVARLPEVLWIIAMLAAHTLIALPVRALPLELRKNVRPLCANWAMLSLLCGLLLFCVQLVHIFENLDRMPQTLAMLGDALSPIALSLLMALIFASATETTSKPLASGGHAKLGGALALSATGLYLYVEGYRLSSLLQSTSFTVALGLVVIAWYSARRPLRWLALMRASAVLALFGCVAGAAHILHNFSRPELIGPGAAVAVLAVIYGGFSLFASSALALREAEPSLDKPSYLNTLRLAVAGLYLAAFILLAGVALAFAALGSS